MSEQIARTCPEISERDRNAQMAGPRPAIGNTAELTLKFTRKGQVLENVVHQTYDNDVNPGWTVEALTNRCGDLKDWFYANRTQWASDCSLTEIVAEDIGVAGGGTRVDYTGPLPLPGINPGETLPNSITKAMKLGSSHAGRSYRGRIFHTGMTDAFLNTGNQDLVSDSGLAALQAIYEDLRTRLTQGVGDDARHMSVVSWKLAIATKVEYVAHTSPYISSMRRRLT